MRSPRSRETVRGIIGGMSGYGAFADGSRDVGAAVSRPFFRKCQGTGGLMSPWQEKEPCPSAQRTIAVAPFSRPPQNPQILRREEEGMERVESSPCGRRRNRAEFLPTTWRKAVVGTSLHYPTYNRRTSAEDSSYSNSAIEGTLCGQSPPGFAGAPFQRGLFSFLSKTPQVPRLFILPFFKPPIGTTSQI